MATDDLLRIVELEAWQLRAVAALQFCSGSADFAPEGQAYEGWRRLCAPLLEPRLVAIVNQMAAEDAEKDGPTGPVTGAAAPQR